MSQHLRELAEARQRAADAEQRATLAEVEIRELCADLENLRADYHDLLERGLEMAFRLEQAEKGKQPETLPPPAFAEPCHVDD
jgi:uncharacterized membrane protein